MKSLTYLLLAVGIGLATLLVPGNATVITQETPPESGAILELRRVPEDGVEAHGTLREEYTVLIENGAELKHGRYRKWHRDPYWLAQDCWYYRGRLHGPSTEWKIRGPVEPGRSSTIYRVESQYVDGMLHGFRRSFRTDGSMGGENNYDRGQGHGIELEWHPNGVTRLRQNWEHGKRQGVSRVWHEDGVLAVEWFYVDDKSHGTMHEWHKNGQLKAETTYKNGKRDGVAKEWNNAGELVSIKTYRDGELVKEGE